MKEFVADSAEITIYTSPHCSFCREAVAFFENKHLSFKQLDVSGNRRNQEEMLALGGLATPFIIVGKQVFHSFDKEKLEEVLS